MGFIDLVVNALIIGATTHATEVAAIAGEEIVKSSVAKIKVAYGALLNKLRERYKDNTILQAVLASDENLPKNESTLKEQLNQTDMKEITEDSEIVQLAKEIQEATKRLDEKAPQSAITQMLQHTNVYGPIIGTNYAKIDLTYNVGKNDSEPSTHT